jgi:hypothetical protein
MTRRSWQGRCRSSGTAWRSGRRGVVHCSRSCTPRIWNDDSKCEDDGDGTKNNQCVSARQRSLFPRLLPIIEHDPLIRTFREGFASYTVMNLFRFLWTWPTNSLQPTELIYSAVSSLTTRMPTRSNANDQPFMGTSSTERHSELLLVRLEPLRKFLVFPDGDTFSTKSSSCVTFSPNFKVGQSLFQSCSAEARFKLLSATSLRLPNVICRRIV